ncbi:hypothetical protein SAMN02745148_01546 [Modicisalibacter ilicicola DSM 19980]|uniref:Uncharacterized protein n=1 Tax=Modicisalibacter ilicicola DSM 19980 TaxID=1121942 RepID=A0A1M4Y0Y4_9GAMM|nr:hypothetical protein [Halomonas ilicicola]SHE99487.1 hypothetical protein SAMN02745148_01546 [Halomonas ilicicola DSM 19980]
MDLFSSEEEDALRDELETTKQQLEDMAAHADDSAQVLASYGFKANSRSALLAKVIKRSWQADVLEAVAEDWQRRKVDQAGARLLKDKAAILRRPISGES